MERERRTEVKNHRTDVVTRYYDVFGNHELSKRPPDQQRRCKDQLKDGYPK